MSVIHEVDEPEEKYKRRKGSLDMDDIEYLVEQYEQGDASESDDEFQAEKVHLQMLEKKSFSSITEEVW